MQETTRTKTVPPLVGVDPAHATHLGLSIAWSLTEPARVGEVALLPPGGGIAVLGRGSAAPGEAGVRLVFGPRRPDGVEPGPPLVGNGLSRRQLLVRAHDGSIELERIGRTRLIVSGQPRDHASLEPGSTCVIEGQLVLDAVSIGASALARASSSDTRNLSVSVERHDIPLAVRSLLRRAVANDAGLRARFVDDFGEPRISPDLVVALCEHRGPILLRELVGLLDLAVSGSRSGYIALTPAVAERPHVASALPNRERVEEVLVAMRGDLGRAWKELGLPSRDSLTRLLKKYGIAPRRY